jgi:TolB-like protein/Tfp pilus assembly protein PilF
LGGYRFVAPVTERASEPDPIDSVAVLPFVNEGGDPEVQYVADGVTESLIGRLGRLGTLRVMSRNSVFRYVAEGSHASLPDAKVVGRELGVRSVLFGRVRQAADELIVRVELVDARDDRHLLGAHYRRRHADVFELQESLAQAISERLRAGLTAPEARGLVQRAPDPEAFQLYLKARFYWNKLTPDGVQRSVDLFRQAIEKDPTFALAHAGLLSAHTYLAQPAEARAAGQRALDLDPTLGEAHAALAFAAFLYDWDWAGAGAGFERAIDLSPNYAEGHHWYAIYLASMGRHDEAIREARRAQELDPLSLLMNQTAGNVLLLARQYDRAAEVLLRTIDMDPNFPAAHSVLAFVYAEQGRHEAALSELQRVLALAGAHPQVEASIQTFTAFAHAACGKQAEARLLLAELAGNPAAPAYSLAGVQARLGDRDAAFELLERAFREHSYQLVSLKVDPTLDGLRDDPRFGELLARLRLDT